MTAIVLPGMVGKKMGIIINNGSGAGRSPVPLNTVYSATKAYVDFFSRLKILFILKDEMPINYFNYNNQEDLTLNTDRRVSSCSHCVPCW